jgi:enolase
VNEIIDTYDMFLVEDPIREDDMDGFSDLTNLAGDKCLLVGDDLFVTNASILAQAIEQDAGNAIIIKPNQIGTLSDTYQTVDLARTHGYTPIVSHRSGETTDETIAHLGVAFSCPIIKTGALGGERIAKLNELIRIEEELLNAQMANIGF